MFHFTFTLHVHDLTFLLGVGGEKAAKPVTRVQDCGSTFVSLKPQDIFKETKLCVRRDENNRH